VVRIDEGKVKRGSQEAFAGFKEWCEWQNCPLISIKSRKSSFAFHNQILVEQFLHKLFIMQIPYSKY